MSEKYSSEVTREQLDAAMKKSLIEISDLLEDAVRANCPVDTGRLRDSFVTSFPDGGTAVLIESDTEYAPYVELKTHFLEQASKKVSTRMVNIVKSNL